jgi:DNA-directed RNA polymerase specialized sigma24 family protein
MTALGVFLVPSGEGRLLVAGDSVGSLDDGEIFAELYPSLRRFAAVVRPAEEDADDLVQEALVRTLSVCQLSELDEPAAYLRKAILRIASNRRRSLGRRRRWLMATQTLTPTSYVPAYPSALDDLRRLDAGERAVLYLSVVEGRQYREIASILGCSEGAARARASRATRRLRTALSDQEPTDDA